MAIGIQRKGEILVLIPGKKLASQSFLKEMTGGEGGIRTLDSGLPE